MRKLFVVFSILLLIALSVGYPKLLDLAWPYTRLVFQSGFVDTSFETQYGKIAWSDSNFTQDWEVSWVSGSSSGAGFTTENEFGVLYANFTGYNYADRHGLTGISVKRSLGLIDTRVFPFLSISHIESVSNNALAFSFGVTDEGGGWHDGGLRHVSDSSKNLNVDLRMIYNGTIVYLTIRFANDYDPTYDGGIQKSHIKQIIISDSLPCWMPLYNKPVDADISTDESAMRIGVDGNVAANTIVAAERFENFTFDVTKYAYLRVMIKVSSINVAAQISLYTNASEQHVVLLKTYNDRAWHIETIDLTFFSISIPIRGISLGMFQVYENADSTVYFRQLSFDSLEA